MAQGCDALVSALNIIESDKALQEHWVKRFVAIIIDSLVLYVIVGVILIILYRGDLTDWKFHAVWSTSFSLILFLYSFIMETSFEGATLGKKVLNLRVISIGDEELDFGKVIIRNISKVYPIFLLLDWIIGFITDGDPKQKMLDRIVGTTVVVTTALEEGEQHIYQTQQAKYAPPPQEKYHTRHEQVYQYPPPPPTSAPSEQPSQQTPQQGRPAPEKPVPDAVCGSCGGRMAETGKGRLKCIRCGKIH